MNFANPHFFSAILDGIGHRFILIQECESVQGSKVEEVPRFSVGAVNATRDPRFSNAKQLIEVGVKSTALSIPPGFLMAHQYIYIVHDNTDEQGWQYRSKWGDGELKNGDEPWVNSPLASSMVRRRTWMTTVVDRHHLTLAKRLLSDNVRVDSGGYKMQGELLRYEKGTLTKSWQKRRVALANNRLEFYAGSSKKGEIPLNDCEVRMLFENQCPGKSFAFSIRNPMGNVGILLDAESKEARRSWVLAIQYQLAINSNEFNFPPMEYAPPTGEFPDNRVLLCGDLMLQGRDSEGNTVWSPRHFQLLPREVVYFENAVMMGRIFVENARISGDAKSLNFQIESASGIVLYLSADSPDAKNLWLLGVNKQIQFIENQKLKIENTPKEELNDANIPVADKLALYYDDKWTAPKVEGTDENYLQLVFSASTANNPSSVEFTELVPAPNTSARNEFQAEKRKESDEATEEVFETSGADGSLTTGERKHNSQRLQTAEVSGSQEVSNVTRPDGSTTITSSNTMSKSVKQQSSSTSSSTSRTVSSAAPASNVAAAAITTSTGDTVITPTPSTEPIVLNPRRSLINPKFILTVLKGVTHRFLLAMESETRDVNAKRSPRFSKGEESPVTKFPPRFTVGGPRASKDPRSTPIEELIQITSRKPEIQLPPGWVMMHQYINIVQQNTDENGWQYRSNWAEGTLSSKDEQWVERYKPGFHFVRRRLWMTTVVKKSDVMAAKKLVYDSLNSPPKKDIIMQGNLYRYNQELGQSSTSWQRRKVLLYHNKLEFFIGNERKGEAELDGCVVRMLFGPQCPGRNYAFSLRNASGSVNCLLEAENEETRLVWVKALAYQISILAHDVNFPPLPYSPPTGELPANRILYCGDLQKDGETLHFQLKHTQLLYFQKGDKLFGRLNLEQASMTSVKEETGDEFAVRFKSGYILSVCADSPETKLAWVRAIRRQVARIESEKAFAPNTPAEELSDDGLSLEERFARGHDTVWTAPAVDLEAEVDFLNTEQGKLYELSGTEIWDGSLKTVSRPSSLPSMISTNVSPRSPTSSSAVSSPKESLRSPVSSSRASDNSNNQVVTETNQREERQEQSSSSQQEQTTVQRSVAMGAPQGISQGLGSSMVSSNLARQQGVTTTTSKVTSSSTSSSSSTFKQSSTSTGNVPTSFKQAGFPAQSKLPAGFGGGFGGGGDNDDDGPLQLLRPTQQPMTIDSDSD